MRTSFQSLIGARRALGVGAACAAALTGCAAESTEGRRILGDLAAAGIAIPDDQGRAADEGEAGAPALPPGPLTLEDLLARAESHSPRLAAARSRIGVAAGMAWQASLYPNPMGEAMIEDLSTEQGTDTAMWFVAVTQPLVLGDRLSDAHAAGLAEQAAAAAEVEAARREVLEEVETLFTEAVAAGEALRLNAELAAAVEGTLAVAQGRFEAGAAPESDVVRPRIELARLRQEAHRLRREAESVAARLGVLVGAPVEPGSLSGELPRDLAPIDEAAMAAGVRAAHPAVVAAQAEVAAAEARLRQVRSEVTPDLEVTVGAGYDQEMTDAVLRLGAGVAIPVWDRRQGDILAARFAVLGARQEVRATETELLGELSAAAADYRSAADRWRASREEVIPAARQAFELAEGAYRAGRGTFIDMLDAQRTLIEAQLMVVEEARDAARARVRLRWLAEGRPLPVRPAETRQP